MGRFDRKRRVTWYGVPFKLIEDYYEHRRNEERWVKFERRSLIVLALILSFGLGVCVVAFAGDRLVSPALMWGLGLSSVGLFLGFLFALPRAGQITVVAPPRRSSGEVESQASTGALTNNIPQQGPTDSLLEISDWLTKIIVGLGLVNLGNIPAQLQKLAVSISDALEANGQPTATASAAKVSFALAMTIFFPTISLLISYFVTRLYLQIAFIKGDLRAQGEAAAGIDEAEMLLIDNKQTAEMIAADRQLPRGTAAPPQDVIDQLEALNADYTDVRIDDYDQRVERKNELVASMLKIAFESNVNKGWLAAQRGDGYIHVLATASLTAPQSDDLAYLLKLGGKAAQKHAKFRVVEALANLVAFGLMQKERMTAVRDLLTSYEKGADETLLKMVELAKENLKGDR